MEPNVVQINFEIDESAIVSGRIASNTKISMKRVECNELTLGELDIANNKIEIAKNEWAGHKDASYAHCLDNGLLIHC